MIYEKKKRKRKPITILQDFNIEDKWRIWLKYDRHCALCGDKIPEFRLFTLITKDNSFDLRDKNVQAVCLKCFRLRGRMTNKQFKKHIKSAYRTTFNYLITAKPIRLLLKFNLIDKVELSESLFYYEKIDKIRKSKKRK